MRWRRSKKGRSILLRPLLFLLSFLYSLRKRLLTSFLLHRAELPECPGGIPIVTLRSNLATCEGQNRNAFDGRLFALGRNT